MIFINSSLAFPPPGWDLLSHFSEFNIVSVSTGLPFAFFVLQPPLVIAGSGLHAPVTSSTPHPSIQEEIGRRGVSSSGGPVQLSRSPHQEGQRKGAVHPLPFARFLPLYMTMSAYSSRTPPRWAKISTFQVKFSPCQVFLLLFPGFSDTPHQSHNDTFASSVRSGSRPPVTHSPLESFFLN